MKKYMPLEGLRWSRDSGSTLCDTPQNGRSRTGWVGGAGKEICGIGLSHYHLIQFLVSYYHFMQTRLFVLVEAETEHIACLQMVIVEIFAEL